MMTKGSSNLRSLSSGHAHICAHPLQVQVSAMSQPLLASVTAIVPAIVLLSAAAVLASAALHPEDRRDLWIRLNEHCVHLGRPFEQLDLLQTLAPAQVTHWSQLVQRPLFAEGDARTVQIAMPARSHTCGIYARGIWITLKNLGELLTALEKVPIDERREELEGGRTRLLERMRIIHTSALASFEPDDRLAITYVGQSKHVRQRWHEEDLAAQRATTNQRTLSFFLEFVRPEIPDVDQYDVLLFECSNDQLDDAEALAACLLHPHVNVAPCGASTVGTPLFLDPLHARFVDGKPTFLPCRGKHSQHHCAYLPIDQFWKHTSAAYGREATCKACMNSRPLELLNARYQQEQRRLQEEDRVRLWSYKQEDARQQRRRTRARRREKKEEARLQETDD